MGIDGIVGIRWIMILIVGLNSTKNDNIVNEKVDPQLFFCLCVKFCFKYFDSDWIPLLYSVCKNGEKMIAKQTTK